MKNKSVNKQIFQEAFDLMNSERNSVFLDELEHKIGEAVMQTKQVQEAKVISAVEFTDLEKQKFSEIITKIIKHEIKIYYHVDENVIGGFRVHLGDWKLDGTIIYQLERMKRALGGN